LLLGLTEKEKNEGYFTNLNDGIKINSFNVVDGIAKIDFSRELDENMAGSCRVTAARAQIIDTLKQFSDISDVIISVNGRTEDVLQP
jgi:spore germination protein GerM